MTDQPQRTPSAAPDRLGRQLDWSLVLRALGGALAVFTVAAAIRALGLGQEALHDELYHFLAAKNYLADGTLSINGGEPYDRARPFTLLVAWVIGKLGATLQMARLPALLAGSALAALVFVWLRAHGEPLAAWIAGLLICVDPLLVELSQIVRFYSVQHLAFAAGSIGLFEAYRARKRPRLGIPLGLAAAGLLFVAFRLQVTALIGIAGIGASALVVGLIWLWNRLDRRRFLAITLGAAGVAIAGFVLLVQTDWYQTMLSVAWQVDRWQRAAAGNVRYYYAILIGSYAPLWSLVPLLFVLGFRRQRGIVFYAATIFAVGFLAHSFVPRKAQRYFVYLLPFLFVVFAAGMAGSIPLLRRLGSRFASLVSENVSPLTAGGRRVLSVGVTAAVLATVVIGNHAFLETYRLATRDHSYSFPLMGPFDPSLSWERAAPELKSRLGPSTAVVSADDLKAIHYLGQLDYALSPSHLSERNAEDREFWHDPRVDRPVVSEPGSIGTITRCHRRGLIVVQTGSWNNPASVPRATAEYIRENLTEVELPRKWGLKVFRWSTRDPVELEECWNGEASPRTASGDRDG